MGIRSWFASVFGHPAEVVAESEGDPAAPMVDGPVIHGPGPYRASEVRPHAWVPIKADSALYVCLSGCGWRRLRMSANVSRVDMTAFVRGFVSIHDGVRSDMRLWTDEEPSCPGSDVRDDHIRHGFLTTGEWCAAHSENRSSISAVYEEFCHGT